MAAEVGEKAPDFTLPADDRENTVSLEFYTKRGPVALFVISADSSWSHRDFDKEVIEDYGVRREAGFPERAKRVESSPKDRPGVEAVPGDLDKAL